MPQLPTISPQSPAFFKYLKLFFAINLVMTAIAFLVWISDGTGLFANRDFLGFWSASHLLHLGHAELAYDTPQLLETARMVEPKSTATWGWIHPPTTLLLYWPIGLFPCALAWILFVLATTTFLILALRKIVAPPLALWVTLASPAVAFNAWNGQTAALNAALMTLALITLEKRPALSGFAGAVLACCKPHLAALLFLVEFFHRRKPLFWAIGIIAAIVLLTTLILGFSIWQVWLHSLPINDFSADNGGVLRAYDRMASIFSIGRYIGLTVIVSWVPHAIVALAAMGIVLALWHKSNVSYDIRAASVPLATLLISPYLFYYDYVLVLPSLAFWMRHIATHGSKPWEFNLMALVWAASIWLYCVGGFIHMIPLPQMVILAALVFLLRRDTQVVYG